MFYCTPKGTLTALPVIHASFIEVPHTCQKPWKNRTKPKKQTKTIFLDSLEGGAQPRLSVFFCFFHVFFGFGHFQPFAPCCTFAVRCLHAFKLAGTYRLTTAAMNILGLRIKTVCSNFEMFGHVLHNNLSFMLYFFEKHVA